MPTGKRPASPIERLYALWAIGLILTLIVVVAGAFLLSGYSARQTQAINRLNERVTALETAMRDAAEARRAEARHDAQGARIVSPSNTEEMAPSEANQPRPQAPATPAVFHDQEISDSIRAAVRRGDDGLIVVANPAAADATLRAVLRNELRAAEGATFARLAVLAAVLGDAKSAEAFGREAETLGETPLDYYETRTRQALLSSANAEALRSARQFATAAPESPKARALLALALARMGAWADAFDVTESPLDFARVPMPDRLMLGRLLIALEQWSQLTALTATLPAAAEDPQSERARRLLVAAERLAGPRDVGDTPMLEVIATLERLLAENRSDVEARVWLAIAYFQAGQYEAARTTLSVDDPSLTHLPEPSYWLGRIELETGNLAQAESYFRKAVEISESAAAAWEALASLAMNRDEIPEAIELAENAVLANPRRASAHFLLAIANARANEPEPAAKALRDALAINPALLGQAAQTALGEIFTPDELSQLLPDSAAPAANPTGDTESNAGGGNGG
ncbi:MAG: tetratricopeptide repeat protein [Phycisphaerales bacterium]|nr:tetratricopeptide repeat protein [Phycisphaerales bacterium]